ncbi:helix-turn-helix domain-containing protein [Amycolatopsis sp. H20-H5]|uniref:helix-turn-helix domain-containing protein n=1 Tax=Amycolatopsis sp. H20-H5 TaxID=3046309 RepID=UPI002DB98573|nr:helix-turn-helix domain-containing protein [Amycolatopsis sp. H20-H5]MEC3982142.1 helix-turn-helix domain-containing protein [Amycolatopsis sp. H20-H5]
MPEFGAEVRRRRQSAGMSLTALAAAVHFTKGYLSKVENGKARVNRGLAEACDRALAAQGELLALAVDPASPARRSGGIVGLPEDTRHFVGREAELAALSTLLRGPGDLRVGVVHGMAGAGKTAVVVAAARLAADAFPDGCLFFDLHGHTPGVPLLSPSEGLRRLLRLLDVGDGPVPADQDGLANLFRDRLRGRRMLLVFDNVRSAEQVRPLIPGEQSCRVLITSRGRLPALDDARHIPVPTLSRPAALALLRSIAGDRAPEDETVAAEIVGHCGLLPLAVRIAAARFVAGGWSATRFRDRLADETTRLAALDDGERSVAAAFALSYEALPADQRRLFGLLALHPAAPAEAVSIDALAGLEAGEADRLLDRLHDAHLVSRDAEGAVELHDLLRRFAVRYALPEIAEAERRAAAARLVGHTVAAVAAADELAEPHRFRPELDCPRPAHLSYVDADGALAWQRAQWPGLAGVVELAADHRLYRHCWQLAFILRAFFFRERLFEPWIRTHRRALEAAEAAGDLSATGMILNNLGMACVESGDLDEAVLLHERARVCFAGSRDERGATDALSSLAWARLYRGDAAAALDDLTAVLALYRDAGRIRNVVIALRGLAFACAALNRFPEARLHADEARSLAQLPVDLAMSVTCLAWVHFGAGSWEDAGRRYAEAAELADLAGSEYERARALLGLGNVAASRGDPEAAARYWAEAAAYRVTLDPVVLGEARSHLELTGPARPIRRR